MEENLRQNFPNPKQDKAVIVKDKSLQLKRRKRKFRNQKQLTSNEPQIKSTDQLLNITEKITEMKEITEKANSLELGKGDVKPVFLKINEFEILLPRVSGHSANSALAVIAAVLLSSEFSQTDTATPELCLSIYFGIYNTYIKFADDIHIYEKIKNLGYKITEIGVKKWTTLLCRGNKCVLQKMKNFLEEDKELLPSLAWTLLGSMLCLLGHKPNQNNIEYWGAKMLNTFSFVTKLPKDKLDILAYPNLLFCEQLENILTKLHGIAKYLFLIVYDTISLTPTMPGNVCRLVVEHLRGVGLLDFILVDQYLLIQNPFSLLLNAISDDLSMLLNAYNKYLSYGQLAPWCLILKPEEKEIFQHPRLKYMATIARGLAIKQGFKTLEDYQPLNETPEIQNTIEKAYLLYKATRIQPQSNQ